MDGTYDYLGEPRLVDHAATRVKCCPAASSNGDKVAGSSRGGMVRKQKCEVIIPPVRLSRRRTTKPHGQVIDLCSNAKQSTEESSLSDSDEYRSAVKMDVDEAHASLPKAEDDSSSEELTLLSYTKKRKASLPQPSRPTLSKHVKGSASSQPVALLKGKEPARAQQIKGRHVVISSPVIVSLDEQHPSTPLPPKGPETLFNDDNALRLEDTHIEAHSDVRVKARSGAHDDPRELPEESTGDALEDVQYSNLSHSELATALANSNLSMKLPLLPPALADAPALVSMPTPVNVPAPPVNMPATVNIHSTCASGWIRETPIHPYHSAITRCSPSRWTSSGTRPSCAPEARAVQRGEALDGDNDLFSLRK